MNRSRVGRLLSCAVVAFAAACNAQPSPPTPAAHITYTCCEAADVEKLHEPGQTLTVHWIVKAADGPVVATPGVELTAGLTGPYDTVETLKASKADTKAVAGHVAFAAAPIRPAGTPNERPVSTIVISAAAKPGYYNLITSVRHDGSTASGASIIRIVAKS